MKLKVFDKAGKEVGEMELPKVFDVPINKDLLYQVVTSQEANQRIVRGKVKDRAEVRGGGKKPWRQKGTGRARHGSIRSPIWKGGGVTHGPTNERNFAKKINKKMASRAIAMILGAKAKDGEIIFIDTLEIQSGKTKDAMSVIKSLASHKSLLPILHKKSVVLVPEHESKTEQAFRNISSVEVGSPSRITARELMLGKFLVMPRLAIETLEKRLK
ncbi:MAG: 50S ribosomal protein L4 [Candidatus Sungbacteria bacterium]|uniref:Large ribosomal subunit protein uL4 n=1 Tax=Candidatus Sungiibacteriota bacterium TaxID=2750080 RepID=A0A9D6LQ61_9BACT|nr:50S ribosomal protein L4 [Candidatus Sungbacteria bacterium]